MEEFDIPEEELRRIRAEAEEQHRAEQERRFERAEPRPDEATTPSSQPASECGTWYLLRTKGRKEGPLTTDELIRLQPGQGDRIRPTSDREWVPWEEALARYPELRRAQETAIQSEQAGSSIPTAPAATSPVCVRSHRVKLLGCAGLILLSGGLMVANTRRGQSPKEEQTITPGSSKPKYEWDRKSKDARKSVDLQRQIEEVDRRINEAHAEYYKLVSLDESFKLVARPQLNERLAELQARKSQLELELLKYR